MTKSDLKNGMIAKLRNGYKYIVIDDKMINNEGWMDLDGYTQDLLNDSLYSDFSEWDIVEVYNYTNGVGIFCADIDRLLESKNVVSIYNRYDKDYKNENIYEIKEEIEALQTQLNNLSQKLEELEND